MASGALAAGASVAPVIEYRIKPESVAVRKVLPPSSAATGAVPEVVDMDSGRAPGTTIMARRQKTLALPKAGSTTTGMAGAGAAEAGRAGVVPTVVVAGPGARGAASAAEASVAARTDALPAVQATKSGAKVPPAVEVSESGGGVQPAAQEPGSSGGATDAKVGANAQADVGVGVQGVGPVFATRADDRASAVVSMARHVDTLAASTGDVRKVPADDGREVHAGEAMAISVGVVRKAAAGDE